MFPEQLPGLAGELVMTFRGSMGAQFGRAGCLDGAAGVVDVGRAAVNAKQVVPAHTREAGRCGELFANVEAHDDGQCWTP